MMCIGCGVPGVPQDNYYCDTCIAESDRCRATQGKEPCAVHPAERP